MKPLKILQVSDAYYPFPGGVTEHMHNLTLSLRKLGHKVVIMTTKYNGEKEEKDVVRFGKCRKIPANLTQITWTFSLNLPFEVRRYIRENEFDVIHTHGPLAPNLPYLALHYSRSLNFATFHTAFVGFNWYKIAKLFFKKAFYKLNACICVSEKAYREIYSHFKGDKYYIIPNGIDTERFKPDGEKIEKFPQDTFKILYVGRIEPRKGLPVLLRSFPEIKKKIKESILIVVGEGPFEKEYRESISPEFKKYIYFEGFVSPLDLPKYYRTCDVYVSPALGGETFGIVLLEGMATKKCVVASNIDGYNLVIEDTKTGFLFEKGNSAELANIIINIYKNPDIRKRVAENGYKESLKYNWLSVAKRVESLYYRLKSSSNI